MTRLLLSTLPLLALSAAIPAQFLVAIDSSRAISTIDPTTGTKTQFATATSNASTTAGLAYDAATRTTSRRPATTRSTPSTSPPARRPSSAPTATACW